MVTKRYFSRYCMLELLTLCRNSLYLLCDVIFRFNSDQRIGPRCREANEGTLRLE